MLKHAEIPVEQLAAEGVEFVPGNNTGLLLICEHAGDRIPEGWNNLGLREDFLETHFACDLGARALALELARRLDSALVAARYSRLFFDINRPPDDWECIRPDMGGIPIPGNADVSPGEHALRDRIARKPFDALVEEHLAGHRRLISVHSFSPIYNGTARRTDIGLLHFDGCPLGAALIAALREEPDLVVGDNDPYDLRVSPPGTVHRLVPDRRKEAIAIEIRNDLLADESGLQRIARVMTRALLPYASLAVS